MSSPASRTSVPDPRPRNDSEVRVALVGAGGFARSMHVPNLEREDRARITTVVSRSGSTAASLARSLNGPRSGVDWQEAVEAPDVDLVFVATRHDSHAEIAAAALRAGKAVFVEKPLGLTREEIDDVWAAGADNDRLAIGFNRPFAELSRLLEDELRKSSGPAQLVYRVCSPVAPDHWLNDPREGGGRILGEACHMFDFANWLLGNPERVLAAAVPAPPGVDSPESSSVTIQYADGSVAMIHYSGLGPASMPKERIEVLRGGRSWVLEDFRTLTSFGSDGSSTATSKGDKGHAELLRRRVRGGARRAAVRAGPRSRLPRAERRARRARSRSPPGNPSRSSPPPVRCRLMCGICGILGTRDDFPVDEELVTTMRELIHHRGPDDGGSWHRPEQRVALAHRRLSIIDLSPAGHQPMSNEDGTVWITFSGEIYNHMDLRPELEAKGHVYRSKTDTETIIHLYEEEGPRCVERLDGMFHFAIWDTRTRELHLARDRLGKKPLYYAQPEGGFVFASEIKALLAHPALTAELDEEAFFHYLTFVCTPAPMTMFKGIRKLGPAERMTVRADGTTEIETYWSPMSAGDRRRRRRSSRRTSSRSGCSSCCASRSAGG